MSREFPEVSPSFTNICISWSHNKHCIPANRAWKEIALELVSSVENEKEANLIILLQARACET